MSHRILGFKLVAITVAMFGFGFALVPIYAVFCDLTGLGGRTAATAEAVVERPDEQRSVRLEFVASVDRGAPFEFKPTTASLQVRPGQIYATTYLARNLRSLSVTARAVPSVAPGLAAAHLKKLECFCFTEQAFGPGEARELGVRFMLDPELPEHIDTVTLSYALFALER